MELTNIGQVIATRQIRYEGSGQIAYMVKIGLPQRFPDFIDFYCPVQISRNFEESGSVLYSAGIDAVQALQLAMKLVGGVLFRMNENCGGSLRWDGDETDDLGFPLPV